MCMPREPDVFGHPTRPRSLERRADHAGDLADLRPLHARHRIEIDAHLVGMVEVVGAHRVRVQLEARQVGHPDERGRLARHHLLGRAAGRKAQLDHLDPRRARLRRALLVEELAVDAVGIADQHVGPAAGALQRAIGHGEVVARQIQLGVTGLGEQHLPRVRDRHLAVCRP